MFESPPSEATVPSAVIQPFLWPPSAVAVPPPAPTAGHHAHERNSQADVSYMIRTPADVQRRVVPEPCPGKSPEVCGGDTSVPSQGGHGAFASRFWSVASRF